MNSAGGGWTLILNRADGLESFNRSWHDFKLGFGQPTGDHWIGNSWLNELTTNRDYQLRMEIFGWQYEVGFAEYSLFRVHSEIEDYRLELGVYSSFSNASDCLSQHDDAPFLTYDHGHGLAYDKCIKQYAFGGFWYNWGEKEVHCGRSCFTCEMGESANAHGKHRNNRLRCNHFPKPGISINNYTLRKAILMIKPVG